MQTYVMYSGATDVTGNALITALGVEGGTDLPKKEYDVFIGWGAKTSKPSKVLAKSVFNHPDQIRANRNKLEALKAMASKQVPVGKFKESIAVVEAIKNGELKLPMVGRTKFHQSGKNFWLCLTQTHVKEAISQGAEYFQEYMPIVDEYRLHVFGGKVFYSVLKTKSKDPQKAYVDGHIDKIKNAATTANKVIDDSTAQFVLEKIGARNTHPNPLLRSHAEGWVFKETKLTTTLGQQLSKVATDALLAIGLSFGAVDCGITEDGKPVVVEVNSGPSLEGTSLSKWIEQFKTILTEKPTPKKDTVVTEDGTKVATPITENVTMTKEEALRRMEVIRGLLLNTDDAGAEVIMSASAKLFNTEAKSATKAFGA